MIALVKYRILDTDEKQALRGDILKKAIEEDRAKGLTPFFVSICYCANIRANMMRVQVVLSKK